MESVLDAKSPNSGGATPRRIVKSLKQPLACVTQLVPLDSGEASRPSHLLSRLPATSIPSETSVSEVRSELCSVAYEEPVDESTSSFFDHRRIRHGGKVNSSMSRSRASRTVHGQRARPRRSFRSVSSREVEESLLSYSDEPAFYQCDSEASSNSAATEGSTYSMSCTAISESVPSCSLTTLAEPGKAPSGGWVGRFRKGHGTNAPIANPHINGTSRKPSGSFGSIFGSGGIDPYNGMSLNSHSPQPHGRDSIGSQYAAAAKSAAAGHRKAAAAAAAAGSPTAQYQQSYASIKSPVEFKNTASPSTPLPVAADDAFNGSSPHAGDTTALPDGMDAAQTSGTEMRQKVQHVKLLERVGRGTFGDVYRAEDADTGNIIAVKEIVVPHDFTKDVEKQLAALESEIRVMRRLHHPHVVTYLGANREGNSLRIYMEFVGGGTVGSVLARGGALPEELTRNYTAQLLEGLEYLHASHILHRDLKGDNLFLTEQGELKLGDFGQSKELADTLITQSVQGTPSFMSPEMIACSGYSFEADVWSVGCCVIQMLTGRPPFSNLDNQMAVMFAIISSKIDEQIPDEVSEGAKDFIRMCTKTNIKDRWSATQLRQHPWLLSAAKDVAAAPLASTKAPTASRKGEAARRTKDAGAAAAAAAKQPGASHNKPPRSILLDTAALSHTDTAEAPKKTSSEAIYPYAYEGETPDNEAGGNTSSNLSSTKAESPGGKQNAAKHPLPSRPSRPGETLAPAGAANGNTNGPDSTPRMSPAMPPQPSPAGRRPRRVRSANHGNSNGAVADGAAISSDAGGQEPQGRSPPAQPLAPPKPHRPAQQPGESSPRHRPAAGLTDSTGRRSTNAGGVGQHSNGNNNNANNNGVRGLNTPVTGQGARNLVSPSSTRSGSRQTSSAIQRGLSPGNQTSRSTPNATTAKGRAPATSRPGSHLPKEDRKR